MRQYRIQRPQEHRTCRTKLSPVYERERCKHTFAAAGKRQHHFAPVCAISRPSNESLPLEAIHQLHGAVMLNLKPFCEYPNSRLLLGRQSFNREKCLVLVRLDSRLARRLLAKIQESPDFVPEIRERTVVDRLFSFRGHRYNYIVLRYVVKGLKEWQTALSERELGGGESCLEQSREDRRNA
jgi:hypothetical protein